MKLFVLGLDGATFDCLNPLMEEGILPNITDMCTRWASGPLQTIFPPVTAPAWLALATGLNPGKTGVFDYINKVSADSEKMAPVTSLYYKNKSIWNYLNNKGYKTGIFNYPTLSPPPSVDGFAVSGMGGYKRENMCFPPELEKDLNNITGGYEVKLNLRNAKYKHNISLFFEDIHRIMSKQVKALNYLIETQDWDFFFAVFSFTDWMQHVLWKDIDAKHILYNPDISPSIKRQYKETWQQIDSIIGNLLSTLPDTTHFMIVSDHGAGPLESVFYPNSWLTKKGWLTKKRLGLKGFLAENLNLLSEGIDNKYFNTFLFLLKTKLLKINSSTELIDLDNSLAYSPEHNTMFGAISLTQKGRALAGFEEEVLNEVKNLPYSIDGINHVQVYLPHQIYSGPYVNLSPDILFIVNQHKSTVEIDFAKKVFLNAPSITMRSGGHLPNGVFIGRGDFFKNTRLYNASVLDITPTILALFDCDIPSFIDGKVLVDCIRPDILSTLNIRIKNVGDLIKEQKESQEKGDLEEMKKMLKSLGYM